MISIAAKIQLIHELLDPNIYDEQGNIIGVGTPILSVSEALVLLDVPNDLH